MLELSVTGTYVFYTFFIACALLCMWIAKHTQRFQKVFLFLCFAIIAVPAIFRYRTGIDYNGYIDVYYKYVQLGSVATAIEWYSVERSFLVLCAISHTLTGTPILAFGFYSLATIGLMLGGIWYFRKYANPVVTLFMYLGLYYFQSYNIFRQSLSLAIVFWGIRYVVERKPIRYLLTVIVASVFHNTAVFALVLYWYGTRSSPMGKVLRLFNYVGPVFVTVLLPMVMKALVQIPFFAKYAGSYVAFKPLSIGFGYIIQLVGAFLFFRANARKQLYRGIENGKSEFDVDYFWKQVVVLACITYLLQYRVDNYAGRISLYFCLPCIVPFASLYRANRERKLTFYIQELYPIGTPIILYCQSLLINAQGHIPYIARWLF